MQKDCDLAPKTGNVPIQASTGLAMLKLEMYPNGNHNIPNVLGSCVAPSTKGKKA